MPKQRAQGRSPRATMFEKIKTLKHTTIYTYNYVYIYAYILYRKYELTNINHDYHHFCSGLRESLVPVTDLFYVTSNYCAPSYLWQSNQKSTASWPPGNRRISQATKRSQPQQSYQSAHRRSHQLSYDLDMYCHTTFCTTDYTAYICPLVTYLALPDCGKVQPSTWHVATICVDLEKRQVHDLIPSQPAEHRCTFRLAPWWQPDGTGNADHFGWWTAFGGPRLIWTGFMGLEP